MLVPDESRLSTKGKANASPAFRADALTDQTAAPVIGVPLALVCMRMGGLPGSSLSIPFASPSNITLESSCQHKQCQAMSPSLPRASHNLAG